MAVNFEFLDTFDQKQVPIVDDDEFILGVLEKLLKLLGIEQVLKAGNGGEAREVLEKHAVDLLITDVQMPELDGLSLLKLIRTGQTSAPIFLPSIVVTNLEDEDVLALALSLDVNGFVQKPFTTPMLIKRILVALSESFQEPSGYPYEGVVIESSRLQLDDGGEVLERSAASAGAQVAPPRFVLEPRALHVVQVTSLVAVAREQSGRLLSLLVQPVL